MERALGPAHVVVAQNVKIVTGPCQQCGPCKCQPFIRQDCERVIGRFNIPQRRDFAVGRANTELCVVTVNPEFGSARAAGPCDFGLWEIILRLCPYRSQRQNSSEEAGSRSLHCQSFFAAMMEWCGLYKCQFIRLLHGHHTGFRLEQSDCFASKLERRVIEIDVTRLLLDGAFRFRAGFIDSKHECNNSLDIRGGRFIGCNRVRRIAQCRGNRRVLKYRVVSECGARRSDGKQRNSDQTRRSHG